MLPCRPAFASKPREVVTSSKPTPAASAVGPTILNASPNIPTSVLALREVCASLSTTPSSSSAVIPIPLIMFDAMSAAAPNSIPAADARLSVEGSASMISLVSNPAMPRNWIPSAASRAENAVVAPMSRARSLKPCKVSPVAPVIAETSAIDCSNSRA